MNMDRQPSNVHLPLSGLFAVEKPSGMTAMTYLARLKPLFASSLLFSQQHSVLNSSISSSLSDDGIQSPFSKSDENFLVEMSYDWRNRRAAASQGCKPLAEWTAINDKFVKIGTGGTLDSLANGVLVIGINEGTQNLRPFYESNKTYRVTALLGCETDSGDSKGSITGFAQWSHVTKELTEQSLVPFRGNISQKPSIYPAMKVGTLTLSQYIELNRPLPGPIRERECTISGLELLSFIPSPYHSFTYPVTILAGDKLKERMEILELVERSEVNSNRRANNWRNKRSSKGVNGFTAGSGRADSSPSWRRSAPLSSDVPSLPITDVARNEPNFTIKSIQPGPEIPPTLVIRVTISSGTNIRTLISDIGREMGSAAHVVALTRTEQGPFFLEEETTGLPSSLTVSSSSEASQENPGSSSFSWEKKNESTTGQYPLTSLLQSHRTRFPCIPATILEQAIEQWDKGADLIRDADGWAEWERVVLRNWPNQSQFLSKETRVYSWSTETNRPFA